MQGIAGALAFLGSVAGARGITRGPGRRWTRASPCSASQGSRYWLGYAVYLRGFVAREAGDHPGALADFAEALGICRNLGDRLGYAQCFEGLAPSLVALGMPERAVRLLAAAAPIREALSAPLPALEAPAVDQASQAARVALSEVTFTAAWEGGQALSPERGLVEALDAAAAHEVQRIRILLGRAQAAALAKPAAAPARHFLSVRAEIGRLFQLGDKA